jgi:SRSO17 transposase
VRTLCRQSPIFIGQAWHTFTIRRETREARRWRVKAGRVPLQRGDGTPTDQAYWLLVAHQPETGQWNYFVSNAPARTAQRTLLYVAFKRAEVEHQFRLAKSDIGFFDYESRDYLGLMRHLILCQMVMLFAAEQRARYQDFFPQLTIEQVVRTLNTIAERWLRRRRRRGRYLPAEPNAFALARLRYHQRRNRAAQHARGLDPQRE